jgi:hypothetical protein
MFVIHSCNVERYLKFGIVVVVASTARIQSRFSVMPEKSQLLFVVNVCAGGRVCCGISACESAAITRGVTRAAGIPSLRSYRTGSRFQNIAMFLLAHVHTFCVGGPLTRQMTDTMIWTQSTT